MSNYQKIYNFENGYGASVVWGSGTYGEDEGLFEVAVLDQDGNLCYDTPVTGDVVGFLDFQGVADVLNQIRNLPKESK